MANPSVKQLMLDAVQKLPPDATVEDAMERLYFLAKVERGLNEAAEGKLLTHEEVKNRLGL